MECSGDIWELMSSVADSLLSHDSHSYNYLLDSRSSSKVSVATGTKPSLNLSAQNTMSSVSRLGSRQSDMDLYLYLVLTSLAFHRSKLLCISMGMSSDSTHPLIKFGGFSVRPVFLGMNMYTSPSQIEVCALMYSGGRWVGTSWQ